MDALAGPLHLFAVVLVASGVQKLLVPRPAAEAMRNAQIPVPAGDRGAVLAGTSLGTVEVATGLAGVVVPHAIAVGWLGLFYLAMSGFVVRLRRRAPHAGCGCFGTSSAPPSIAHVVVDITAVVLAALAVFTGVPDIVDVFDAGLVVAVPYLALLATGAGLVLLAPALFADMARIAEEPRRLGGAR